MRPTTALHEEQESGRDNGAGFSALSEIVDAALFGAKALRLGMALRSGLPVPPGVAVSVELLERIAAKEPEALALLPALLSAAGGAAAVRSSGAMEDLPQASGAGLFTTELHITTPHGLQAALQSVHSSASSASVASYQKRMGIEGPVRIAAIVQRMLPAESAGVMFTVDPVTGESSYVIESAWGIGESVVAGRVTPDSYRLDSRGQVVERRAGIKDTELRLRETGGLEEIAVAPKAVQTLSLQDEQLGRLFELAQRCQQVFGMRLDIEWAFAHKELFLLQCRPITR